MFNSYAYLICYSLFFRMDENLRPVRLRKVVLGYPVSETTSEFRFDLTLNYKLTSVIETYSEQKPTLIVRTNTSWRSWCVSVWIQSFACHVTSQFCATRKSVQQGAAILSKEGRFFISSDKRQRLTSLANSLKDNKLRGQSLPSLHKSSFVCSRTLFTLQSSSWVALVSIMPDWM